MLNMRRVVWRFVEVALLSETKLIATAISIPFAYLLFNTQGVTFALFFKV